MTVFFVSIIQADRLFGAVPLEVIHYQQIEETIIVDIQPSAAHGPERAVLGVGLRRESSLRSHIGKRAVSVVMIQRIVIHATDENILVTVIVEVANGDAGIVTRPS